MNAVAGPSRLPIKPKHPFVSADNRPLTNDGIFRVVIISSGSVASIKIPEIVGALSRDPHVAVQVVATKASSYFYTQQSVDEAVRSNQLSENQTNGYTNGVVNGDYGVKVWKDEDEWSDWKKVGDPILHIELRRWADLVVVAPCSADMLAKIAGGICDNLATSLLRALSPSTPTILCPAMNTHMYQHPLTSDHLHVVKDKLGYMVSGPQGAGTLACGDEGPGKMTDWREIVDLIQNFASVYQSRRLYDTTIPSNSASSAQMQNLQHRTADTSMAVDDREPPYGRPPTPPTPNALPSEADAKFSAPPELDLGMKQWHSMAGDKYFERRWWF